MTRAMQVAWGSLAVSFGVVALKLLAWRLTGSVALYSDALETVVNIAAAIGALVALSISAQPPDAQHPYGHQKAEYFSAVVEGVLVLGTALAIGREVALRWNHPEPLTQPLLGTASNLVATAMNLVWSRMLIRFGRKWRSPAILAGGKHLMADVWTSAAVLVGFALVFATGVNRLDLVLGALVAVNIIWVGFTMMRDSVGALMDQAVDPETLARIRSVVSTNAEGALEAHDLRTRQAGRVTFIEFHLVVPERMAVGDAHMICDALEAALRAEIGEAVITIHVEPEGKQKHKGVLVLS
ncbi:MAG TPA: cation diffusion facilitator family transporter [Acetobacteraceae bacterium]|jgi:cation diffusion facilitator family transporter|nr:cation diffusion facilitator family transporter [Acetobacteraceae bacterium]